MSTVPFHRSCVDDVARPLHSLGCRESRLGSSSDGGGGWYPVTLVCYFITLVCCFITLVCYFITLGCYFIPLVCYLITLLIVLFYLPSVFSYHPTVVCYLITFWGLQSPFLGTNYSRL